ncbi:MAG TPA: hypothetical protein VKD71_07300 [Gemmataceae bacterium]|nr:hypothetical protein [Gemmataceae bacterium]
MKHLRILICFTFALVGCNFGSPYYTVEQNPGGGPSLTIHKSKLRDIKVELPNLPGAASAPAAPGMKTPPVSSGSSTSKWTKSSGSEKVEYEVKYTHDGRTITITSVTLDGIPVPRR